MADQLASADAHRPDPLPTLERVLLLPPGDRHIYDLRGALNDNATDLVRRARAVKGWVYALKVHPDHEGPDYEFWFAWDDATGLRTCRQKVGYDSYHWGVSYPRHMSWFMRRIVAGQPVTILLDGDQIRLFGQLEPFVRENGKLIWAAD